LDALLALLSERSSSSYPLRSSFSSPPPVLCIPSSFNQLNILTNYDSWHISVWGNSKPLFKAQAAYLHVHYYIKKPSRFSQPNDSCNLKLQALLLDHSLAIVRNHNPTFKAVFHNTDGPSVLYGRLKWKFKSYILLMKRWCHLWR
jgi:hypothetical protein